MRKAMASSTLAAVVVSSAGLLIGCAELDQTAMGGGTATLICDGGKTFTVTYQDGYETAIIESGGRRAELTKVRTTLGQTPTRALRSPIDRDETAFSARSVQFAPATGTTGVRYSDGDNLLLSRGRQATLELDGETFSNCETPR
jgi:membrane-bound inhibitor of C-type lysozyme